VRENPFDKAAETWDEKPERVEHALRTAEAVIAMAPPAPDARILDYGCGTGTLAAALAGRSGAVVAADTSAGMISQLERKADETGINNIEAIILDPNALPVWKNEFDLVVSSMTLHHVEDIAPLLRLFANALKRGGALFLADLLEEDGSFHSDMEVPHKGFDPEKLAEKLESLGLLEKDIRVIREIEKNGRKYPVFALLAEKIDGEENAR